MKRFKGFCMDFAERLYSKVLDVVAMVIVMKTITFGIKVAKGRFA